MTPSERLEKALELLRRALTCLPLKAVEDDIRAFLASSQETEKEKPYWLMNPSEAKAYRERRAAEPERRERVECRAWSQGMAPTTLDPSPRRTWAFRHDPACANPSACEPRIIHAASERARAGTPADEARAALERGGDDHG